MRRFLLVLVVSALGAGLLGSVNCLIFHSDIGRVFYNCALSFGLAGVVLGKGLLGHRFPNPRWGSYKSADEVLTNEVLWAISLAICGAIVLLDRSIALAAIAGTIAGSIIWPPKARDDTAQFPPVSQKSPVSDASPAVSPGIPDFTQDTRHPSE